MSHDRPKVHSCHGPCLVRVLPEADFSIALATGDDLVRPRDRPRAKATHLARPNVIFEVGAAAMTNVRWMLVKDPGVQLPSDLAGVLYEPRHSHGNWATPTRR